MLGVALPLSFLARVDPFLHYLRPLELLPTYATAWLLLGSLCLPLILVAVLGSKLLQLAVLPRLRWALVLLLLYVSALLAIAPLLLDAVIWVRTFNPNSHAGIASTITGGIVALAALVAAPFALTVRGRSSLLALRRIAALATGLGGLTLLSLPFFQWPPHVSVSDAAADPSRSSDRPNIVLLTIDALSAPHMSLYGSKRPTTPSLDEFARTAAVFDRAYANANFTTTGVATILTGTLPWTHRALQLYSAPVEVTRRASLPALLDRAGYQTGYVATNSFAGASRIGLGPYFSFRRSDAVPIELPCPDRIAITLPYECAAAQIAPLVFVQQLRNAVQARLMEPANNRHYDPRTAIEPALAWLSHVDRRRPVFLWVHLFPPHAPYAAPSPWLGRFDTSPEARTANSTDPVEHYAFRNVRPQRVRVLEARYDEDIQYVDHYAGEFLEEALRELGSDTVVVVMSDHGESFEHGYGGHAGPGLYESIIHIPLIIKLPHETVGRRVDTPVQQIDIAPTLAELAGVPYPSLWEGRSLLPLLQGKTSDATASLPKEVFVMNFEENRRRDALETGSVAIIDGRWKLIHYMGKLNYPDMPQLDDELFDVVSDPAETTNLAARNPEEVRYLKGLISAQLELHGGPMG